MRGLLPLPYRQPFAGGFAIVLFAALALATSPPIQAAKFAGVTVPDSAEVDGQTLALRGAGIRKRLFLKLYVAALYSETDGDGAAVAAADEAMMIRLAIRSDLVTRNKMVDALKDGFEKSTGGNTAPVQVGIDTMLAAMPNDIDPGDVYDLVYVPGGGTTLTGNGSTLAEVDGLDFKEALFGIWLSNDPVQLDMREAMLGN